VKFDKKVLDKIYHFDDELDAFTISIAIEDYIDIFNQLDFAPFKIRDLNHELRRFLEECSSEIPLRYGIILNFTVSREKQDSEKEEKIKTGLKTYFSNVKNSMKREIDGSYQKSTFYVVAAFLLLLTSYSLRPLILGSIIFSTLVEGVSIGGWVFLWEAISTFAFNNRGIREKYKHYRRFSGAPVRFDYFIKAPKLSSSSQ
jgi:hypothetical protein